MESCPVFFSARYWDTSETMSVRSLTASMSSCLMRLMYSRPSLPLVVQPPTGKEQSLVRPEGVPVRHARDVVGHPDREVTRRSMVLLGHVVRMVEEMLEQ